MEELDRPSFSAEVCESIEDEQYKVHKLYWDILDRLGVTIHLHSIPRPPKQPLRLHRILGEYACALFDIEAARYPDSPRVSQWLEALARRIEAIVLEKLAELAMSSGLAFSTLEYHLTKHEMLAAIRAALAKRIETYVPRSPLEAAPANSTVVVIDDRTRSPAGLPPETALQSTARKKSARQAFVLPILDKKGWSLLDWAIESKVAYHTASDYFHGLTKPYRSTRVKLAQGLGVSVDKLPT
jgi:lambda repressor-like predicted transcriptional regulator